MVRIGGISKSVLLSLPYNTKPIGGMRIAERKKRIDRVLQVLMWGLMAGILYFGNAG
ncbi:MAG: hypothetical protein Roseis2KO_15480 [Roseivirga sp.]